MLPKGKFDKNTPISGFFNQERSPLKLLKVYTFELLDF